MSIKEYGFWEYSCPFSGQAAWYQREDWERLLDDMAGGGMNSLALVVKWATTGYRSSLPWLDQDPKNCAAVATGNELLQQVLDMAHQRGIKVWIAGVCSGFMVREFGIAPPDGKRKGSFAYDPDYPGVLERICELFREITALFQAADGLVVEMESVDSDWPHRVPLYNQWAEANRRPSYGELKAERLDARHYQKRHWRDFTTSRRCLALQEIEKTVRGGGFRGGLAMICETSNEGGAYVQAVNLHQYRESMPGWAAVTYDYNRHFDRWADVDFCIEQPKRCGLETYYLGRGVMTFEGKLGIPLAEHWRLDLEDVRRFQPDGFWFFGTDAAEKKNCHSWRPLLQEYGFADGLAARRELLSLGRQILGKGT